MNKILYISLVALLTCSSINAFAQEKRPPQRPPFDKEAFIAKRNAFITTEIGLTPDEAAEIIPLYNELQEKMFEAGSQCRKLTREMRHNSSPTEADYLKVNDECSSVALKEATLEKEYYEKFKKILSAEKLYKFQHSRYKFARDFMRIDDNDRERRDRR